MLRTLDLSGKTTETKDPCNRILSETILLTATNERDYKLTVRVVPIIPSLSSRHFAASALRLVSVCGRAAIPTFELRESDGITEEDAVRGYIRKVDHFLRSKDQAPRSKPGV